MSLNARVLSTALLAFGPCCYAWADGVTDVWRDQVEQARMLAENNAPAAYRQVLRLQTTIPADAMPADRIHLLNVLSRIEMYQAQTDAAAAHAQQAFDLAKKYGDKVGQAEADLNVAINAINQGNIEAMSAAAIHGMTILEGVNRPDLLSEAMLRGAMMYRRLGLLDESVTLAMQAMEVARRSNDPVARAYAHQGMALSLEQSGHYGEARDYYMHMREQARVAHSRRLEAEATVGMACMISQLGDVSRSERLLREGIGIWREIGLPFGEAYSLNALASNLDRQHRTAEALINLDHVVEIYTRHHNKIGLWWTLMARSPDYQLLGRLDAASADAERAYRLAREIGFPLYIGESVKRLAAIAAARGDHRRAYALSIEAEAMADKAAHESADKRMVELSKRYEAESKKRQLDELHRRNERQAAELKQRELQQRWLATIAAGGFVIFAVTVFFLVRLRLTYRKLQQAKNDQQAILDAVPDLLFEVGLDGRYYECHVRTPELLVAPIESLLGKTVSDVMPPDAAKVCLSALREAHVTGLSTGKQYSLLLAQGVRWFELSVARKSMRQDDSSHFIILSRDITPRKAAEEQLALREQEFRSLVENVLDPIIRYDCEGRRVYVNKPVEFLARKMAVDLQGVTVPEVAMFDSAAGDEQQRAIQQVLKTGRPSAIELEYELLDQQTHVFNARYMPEFGPDGNIVGVLMIARDITGMKHMATMLRELAIRNESVREAERKHIAREVHDELGQMLNAMRLNVQVLDYQFGSDNPPLREKLQKMLENLDRTIGMVRNVVSALHPTVLGNGIVAALEWLTQEFSQTTGIACNLWIDDGITFDEAQVTAIFRIVQESLTNVLRHSGADLVEVSLTRSENGDTYLLEIVDNGKGFDTDEPRKQTSLGLIGMQERAIMLGGSISLSSATERGTVLQVTIPANQKVLNGEPS